jgi:hypothetical protein
LHSPCILISDGEYFFMYLLDIHLFSFEKFPFRSFAYCLIRFFFFFLVVVVLGFKFIAPQLLGRTLPSIICFVEFFIYSGY